MLRFHTDGFCCVAARWTAIQNDPRWPPVLEELLERGLVLGDCKPPTNGKISPAAKACNEKAQQDPHYLDKAMRFTKDESADNNRNVWNAVRDPSLPIRSHLPSHCPPL